MGRKISGARIGHVKLDISGGDKLTPNSGLNTQSMIVKLKMSPEVGIQGF